LSFPEEEEQEEEEEMVKSAKVNLGTWKIAF
jgi:hypothetical protein